MLNLDELGEGRIPAITRRFGNALAELAGVCLESQGHARGVNLLVQGISDNSHPLTWPLVTEQAFRAYDPEEATEYGATGIAVLLAKHEIGFVVIERSRKGSGIDYWMGDETDTLPFQRRARLEVSGIRQGDESAVRTRVQQKLKQAKRSDETKLPAFVIVVEFGRPLAEVQER